MKMTRKLIPALVMLIVSALMLSTASFAWFANSTTVTAQSMTVKANTAVKYFEISNAYNGSYGPSADAQTEASGNLDLIHAKVSGTTVTWYTGQAANPDASTADKTLDGVDPDTGLVEASVGDRYALINTFYVRMSSEESTLSKLTIKSVTLSQPEDNLAPAVRVLVIAKEVDNQGVSGDTVGVQLWDVGDTNPSEAAGVTNDDVLVDEIKDGAVYALEVYIYFDGEDNKAYTDNVAGGVQDQNVAIVFGEQDS